MASRFFRGASSSYPGYLYRADGSITCQADGGTARTFGKPFHEGCTVTVRLDFSDWSLAFAINGAWQGVAFRFTPTEDPEPLFPVVLFGALGEAVEFRPPSMAAALDFYVTQDRLTDPPSGDVESGGIAAVDDLADAISRSFPNQEGNGDATHLLDHSPVAAL